MTTELREANAALRQAVGQRIDAAAAGKTADEWYAKPSAADVIERFARDDGENIEVDDARAFRGDALLAEQAVHPVSQKYFDLLDTLRELHISKSAGYGCPDGTDPLLNIRRGAEFVGIPAWQGAMVRLSDKVTRLAVFNKTGNLPHESVEDNLLDLASYSLLALLLYREERGDG